MLSYHTSGGLGGSARVGASLIDAVLLGTGTSAGVPFLGCNCPVCTSPDPRNQRLRSSVWLHDEQRSIILDCGPDFRQQALRAGIPRVDAVVLTHEHFDHIFGLDDLRLYILRARQPMPILGDAVTLDCVSRVFAYAFDGVDNGSFKPRFDLVLVPSFDDAFEVAGVRFEPLPVEHGNLTVLGLRIGDFAYVPDCKRVPEATLARMAGLDTLVIDGLRHTPHNNHMSRDEALEVIAQVQPRSSWLTHLTHEYDHDRDEANLPEGVKLAYDGLTLPVTGNWSSASANCAPSSP